MKKSILFFIIFFMMFASVSQAQLSDDVSKVGITAAPFLTIGIGARATGMGAAFVGTSNDASALYWNPAGIAKLRSPEGIFSHSNWLADIGLDFVGFVLPIGRFGAVGVSILSLSMEDMLVRTEERPLGTGEYFSSSDIALALSYGLNLTDRFTIGFTGKYIRQQIWKETAQGFAVDLGTLFTTGFHGMRIGASLTNFGTEMRMSGEDLVHYFDLDPQHLGNNDEIFAELKTDSWPLPLTFQVGVAMEILNTEMNRVTVGLDAVQPTDNTESLNFGMEYALREMFFLRGGYRNLFLRDGEEGFTFGMGADLYRLYRIPLKFDYGFLDFGRLQNVHYITVGIIL